MIHYQCVGANHERGEERCIVFGGLRVDAAVAKQVLEAVAGNAIEAALQAAEQMRQRRQELRGSIALELEQARYEARLAARRYEAVDPDQRQVAAELEARWNVSLPRCGSRAVPAPAVSSAACVGALFHVGSLVPERNPISPAACVSQSTATTAYLSRFSPK